nr:TetR family transcriptional regulator [uncultured bacterium]
MFDEHDTQDVILQAAMTRFSTTVQANVVNDIADEAGLSRPTLYAYFKNKQAILRSLSETIHNATLTSIAIAFSADGSLHTRLVDGFLAWSEPFMDILFGSPHGDELIGVGGTAASDIAEDARSKFHKLLVKQLTAAKREGDIDLSLMEISINQAAEFLILSLNGLSTGEANIRTHKRRLTTLVRVFLSAAATPQK